MPLDSQRFQVHIYVPMSMSLPPCNAARKFVSYRWQKQDLRGVLNYWSVQTLLNAWSKCSKLHTLFKSIVFPASAIPMIRMRKLLRRSIDLFVTEPKNNSQSIAVAFVLVFFPFWKLSPTFGGYFWCFWQYYHTYSHSGAWYVYFLPSIRAESLL